MQTYHDGAVCTCSWQNGRLHGYGKYVFPNGDYFEGYYDSDRRHGKAKERRLMDNAEGVPVEHIYEVVYDHGVLKEVTENFQRS